MERGERGAGRSSLPSLGAQKSTATSTLDVGEDRIVFHARPSLYHLELALPVPVKAEDTGAQFNRCVAGGVLDARGRP